MMSISGGVLKDLRLIAAPVRSRDDDDANIAAVDESYLKKRTCMAWQCSMGNSI